MSILASWNAAIGAVADATENFNRQSYYDEINESRKATYAARAETAQLNRDITALHLQRMKQKMDELNAQPKNSFEGVEQGFEIVHPSRLEDPRDQYDIINPNHQYDIVNPNQLENFNTGGNK